MTGFKPGSSVIVSDRCVNCATTTALISWSGSGALNQRTAFAEVFKAETNFQDRFLTGIENRSTVCI